MPKVLGRYHIISELGRGGMGVVYKAVDPKLERFIAIKCLSDELSNDEITVTRFLREARNVAALNHPHIAQIFLADEDEGKPYFVMEFIDGESLAERLARDKRLMPEQARRIIAECAEALKAAHEENIVHRDIKPGNIMIDRRGRSVLTDFGIASIVHPDNQPKTSKYIMGTPGYLPPEVMTGRPADHRGDIFALGAVYYEMLAGKRLVPGSGIEDTARTLLAADFPELGDLDEQLDEATFGVLGRMLAPDPDKRYSDYDALLAELRADAPVAMSASGVVSDPVSEPTRLATPPPSAPVASAAAPAATPPATEAIRSTGNVPPATLSSPPPAGRHRVRNASIVVVAVLGLVAVTLGAIRMMPDSLSDAMPGSLSELTDRWSDRNGEPRDSGAESLTTDSDADLRRVDSGPASGLDSELSFGRIDQRESGQDQAMARADDQRTETDETAGPVTASPEPGDHYTEPTLTASAARLLDEPDPSSESISERPTDPAPIEARPAPRETTSGESLQMARAAEAESNPAEPGRSAPARAPSTVPATRPDPAAGRPATGVLVLGQGDPVFVDPMVREVEQMLADAGHEVIERGFVRGLSSLVSASELDLAELARVGRAAGAGKAVVVRAMPAGQRQLEYYGRSDTSFIVQTETVTYDLNRGRRLGASELEQTEYTALNATRQARDAIAPRLALISEQVGQ